MYGIQLIFLTLPIENTHENVQISKGGSFFPPSAPHPEMPKVCVLSVAEEPL